MQKPFSILFKNSFLSKALNNLVSAKFSRNLKLKSNNLKKLSSNDQENPELVTEYLNNVVNKQANPFTHIDKVEDYNVTLNQTILKIRNISHLYDLYEEKNSEFNTINYCTILNHILELAKKDKNVDVESLNNRKEVKEIYQILKQKIPEMNEFSFSNFLSNLTKLNIMDEEIINLLIKKILSNKIKYNENSLSYTIWNMAKYNINNKEFLEYTKGDLLEKVSYISIFLIKLNITMIEKA